jgi:iron(III) transport system substrate-binding protein
VPKTLLTLLLAALLALPLAACGGDDGDSAQAGEGDGDALVVYSGRNRDLIGDLLERYQRDTGEKLKVRFGESPDLAATLIEEGKNSPADVFLSQDAGALGAVQAEGLLARLPQDVLGEVDDRFRSDEGRWVGLTGRARVIAYDPRELKPADLPRSVLDLTDEKWKGRVGWAPTNASFETFVTALRKLRGEDVARDWLEGMVANDTKTFPNNITIRDAIANGELDLGIINHYYVAEAYAAEGRDYPVGLFYPPKGDPGALVNVSGAGILATTERRPAAEKFVRYMLDRTAQEFYARTVKEYPLAAGVKPDPGLKPLDDIQQPEGIDLSALGDLKATVELLQETGAL